MPKLFLAIEATFRLFVEEYFTTLTRQILFGSLFSFASAVILSASMRGLNLMDAATVFVPIDNFITDFFLLVLFAPFVETVFSLACLKLLQKFIKKDYFLIVCVALIMASLHSTRALVWGVIVFIPFLIFTALLYRWSKVSWFLGLFSASSCHAIHNALASLLVYFG